MLQFRNMPKPDDANWIPLYCPECRRVVGMGLYDGKTMRVHQNGPTKCPHVVDKWKPYTPKKQVQRSRKPPVIWTPPS